ncbi:transcriptional regulator [Nocardiopsis aegyptia]|uniref:transcriptional regulator n=1 Tax=Nocardiopsis aegyptia TaxID=220378 RepID=UPI00366A7AA2
MYSRKIVDESFRLKAQGLTDKAIAAQCGVSVQAIRHWRYGNRRSAATEARRADRTMYCPRCTDAPLKAEAYAYLLGLYLGDGYIGAISKGVDYLTIACCDTWPGLIEECAAAIATVFPVSVFRVRRQGCTEVKATSKHWRCVIPQHGKGHKHSRLIELEPWQQKIVDEQPEAFVRGLIHADGCRLINRIRKKLPENGEQFYEYPRYQFVNTSTDIIDLLTGALDRLDIAWKSHIRKLEPRYRDTTVVSVSRKEAVARMDSFVGPKY